MADHPQIPPISQTQLDDARTYAIIGAAMEVHRTLGSGFLERVYQEALAVEFQSRGILFAAEPALPVRYKEHLLDCRYRPDFICFESVVVEPKALPALSSVEAAQVINYLKASRLDVGLLLNFGAPSLEKRRFAMSLNNAASAESA